MLQVYHHVDGRVLDSAVAPLTYRCKKTDDWLDVIHGGCFSRHRPSGEHNHAYGITSHILINPFHYEFYWNTHIYIFFNLIFTYKYIIFILTLHSHKWHGEKANLWSIFLSNFMFSRCITQILLTVHWLYIVNEATLKFNSIPKQHQSLRK